MGDKFFLSLCVALHGLNLIISKKAKSAICPQIRILETTAYEVSLCNHVDLYHGVSWYDIAEHPLEVESDVDFYLGVHWREHVSLHFGADAHWIKSTNGRRWDDLERAWYLGGSQIGRTKSRFRLFIGRQRARDSLDFQVLQGREKSLVQFQTVPVLVNGVKVIYDDGFRSFGTIGAGVDPYKSELERLYWTQIGWDMFANGVLRLLISGSLKNEDWLRYSAALLSSQNHGETALEWVRRQSGTGNEVFQQAIRLTHEANRRKRLSSFFQYNWEDKLQQYLLVGGKYSFHRLFFARVTINYINPGSKKPIWGSSLGLKVQW